MMKVNELEPLTGNQCTAVAGGSLASVGRWIAGALGGGALYDGVKSGASAANNAWKSMPSIIIGSHFKTP